MKTVKTAIKANEINLPKEIGTDVQEAIVKERDEEKREAMINAAQKGKSVYQVKASKTAAVNNEDETVNLVKEKKRIERAIASLSRRLEELDEQLRSKAG